MPVTSPNARISDTSKDMTSLATNT